MNKTHLLKTWCNYYDRSVEGEKPFEVRKNDRDFQTGDILVLQEFDPVDNAFTGRDKDFVITYILHGGQFGIEQGYVVMGIRPTV